MNCACAYVADTDKPLAELLRFVAAVVPDVPYEVAIEYLRQAYTEFARYSNLLVYKEKIVLQRNVTEYELKAPNGYAILGLVNDEPIGTHLPTPHRWFSFRGQRLRMLGSDRVLLDMPPSQDGHEIELYLHLIPSGCAETIPEEISLPYGYGIAQGAIAELLMMPGRAWSSPRASADYRRRFVIALQAGRNLFLTARGSKRVMMDTVRVL